VKELKLEKDRLMTKLKKEQQEFTKCSKGVQTTPERKNAYSRQEPCKSCMENNSKLQSAISNNCVIREKMDKKEREQAQEITRLNERCNVLEYQVKSGNERYTEVNHQNLENLRKLENANFEKNKMREQMEHKEREHTQEITRFHEKCIDLEKEVKSLNEKPNLLNQQNSENLRKLQNSTSENSIMSEQMAHKEREYSQETRKLHERCGDLEEKLRHKQTGESKYSWSNIWSSLTNTSHNNGDTETYSFPPVSVH